MKTLLVLALVIILGCTTTTAPPPAPAAAQSQFKNLQVLPQDISREQLLATMRGFTRGLGVRCDHCHVVKETTPKEVLDFPLDTKEEKRSARVMLRMVREINSAWLTRLEDPPAAGEMLVTCWTCHRGKSEPESPPAPPPQATDHTSRSGSMTNPRSR